MSILQNAVDSISLGIEDYEMATSDVRRYVSCTRNIFAGILLLFKHKLSELGVVSGNGKYSTLRIFTPTSFNDIQHGIFA